MSTTTAAQELASAIPDDILKAAKDIPRLILGCDCPSCVEAAAIVIAEVLQAERERCARIIEDNMLVGEDREETLLPRTNPGNKVGLAYAAAIRKGGK